MFFDIATVVNAVATTEVNPLSLKIKVALCSLSQHSYCISPLFETASSIFHSTSAMPLSYFFCVLDACSWSYSVERNL